jgi:hypothetical protein
MKLQFKGYMLTDNGDVVAYFSPDPPNLLSENMLECLDIALTIMKDQGFSLELPIEEPGIILGEGELE